MASMAIHIRRNHMTHHSVSITNHMKSKSHVKSIVGLIWNTHCILTGHIDKNYNLDSFTSVFVWLLFSFLVIIKSQVTPTGSCSQNHTIWTMNNVTSAVEIVRGRVNIAARWCKLSSWGCKLSARGCNLSARGWIPIILPRPVFHSWNSRTNFHK